MYDRAELKANELKIHQVRELEVVNALEDKIFTVDSLDQVPAVVRNLCFSAQPKYRIAKDVPGSGNTRNIGAVENLVKFTTGNGPFAMRGEAMFDDYWMYYMTISDAKAAGLGRPPHTNLRSCCQYKNIPWSDDK